VMAAAPGAVAELSQVAGLPRAA
jgi:hypothetical protein